MIIQVKHWGCKLLINSCPRSPHRVSLWRASGIGRSDSKGVKKLVVPIHESCDARSYLRRGRIYYCKNTGWNCIHRKNHGRVCDHNSPSVHFTTAILDWHVLISSVPVPWCLVNHFIRFQDWPHQCWTTSASKMSSWFNLKNKNKCCVSRVARLQLDFQGLFFQLRLPSEKSPKNPGFLLFLFGLTLGIPQRGLLSGSGLEFIAGHFWWWDLNSCQPGLLGGKAKKSD